MRNSAKIKSILTDYSIDITMDEEKTFCLTLIHKNSNSIHSFECNAWTSLIDKAYRYYKKEMKDKSIKK